MRFQSREIFTISTNGRTTVRLHSAAKSIAWALLITLIVFQHGVMAVPLRLQEFRLLAMQPASPGIEIPKNAPLLPSTLSKQKAASEDRSHSELDLAAPDFLQLGSEVENKSNHAMYTPRRQILALLEGNRTAMYPRTFSNSSSYIYKQLINNNTENPQMWPWIHLGSIIRRANYTKKYTKKGDLEDGLAAHKNAGTVRKQAEVDSNRHLDKEERAALLKSVNSDAHRSGLSAFFMSIRRYTVGSHGSMTTFDLAILTFVVLLCLYLAFVVRFGAATGVRAQVEAMRVSKGQSIQDAFQMKERYDCCHFQPLSPGVMLRLQGIVTPGSQGKLVAPLSRRDCVHFSASVSAKRHDGINALPIAFHSVCADFTLKLLDAPHIEVAVYGQDIALFDMKKGTTQDQKRFSESPDHWQDFVLTHRAPGIPGSAALRSENASLEFREVALVAGAVVTCVGELRRVHDGSLRLFPCEEVNTDHDGSAQHESVFRERWRTSWERPEAKAAKTNDKVLISDDKQLLKPSRPSWVCLSRQDGRKESHIDDCEDDA